MARCLCLVWTGTIGMISIPEIQSLQDQPDRIKLNLVVFKLRNHPSHVHCSLTICKAKPDRLFKKRHQSSSLPAQLADPSQGAILPAKLEYNVHHAWNETCRYSPLSHAVSNALYPIAWYSLKVVPSTRLARSLNSDTFNVFPASKSRLKLSSVPGNLSVSWKYSKGGQRPGLSPCDWMMSPVTSRIVTGNSVDSSGQVPVSVKLIGTTKSSNLDFMKIVPPAVSFRTCVVE